MVENSEYIAFMRRIVRAAARRAAEDIDALPQLAEIATLIDQALAEAVAACRNDGYSWADIGARLGITRQAAQQRFGRQP